MTTISDIDVRNKKKPTIKILANYIQIEIFFNKMTFAIDRIDL